MPKSTVPPSSTAPLPAAGVEPLAVNALDWVAGCGLVYGTLFGIGKLVLGDLAHAAVALGAAAVCGATIAYNVARAERANEGPAPAQPAAG